MAAFPVEHRAAESDVVAWPLTKVTHSGSGNHNGIQAHNRGDDLGDSLSLGFVHNVAKGGDLLGSEIFEWGS